MKKPRKQRVDAATKALEQSRHGDALRILLAASEDAFAAQPHKSEVA